MTVNGEKLKNISLSEIPQKSNTLANIWTDSEAFAFVQRQAQLLVASDFVPSHYRGEKGIANCVIALDVARRTNIPPLMVLQNMYVVDGMPSWSGQFSIVLIENCGKFKNIDFELEGEAGNNLKCRLVATRKSDNNQVKGTWITWEMIVKEGWLNKKGSKWQSMPEQMIRYRAASFFVRTYCPEAMLGLQTTEELEDISANSLPKAKIKDVTPELEPAYLATKDVTQLSPEKESSKPVITQPVNDGTTVPDESEKLAALLDLRDILNKGVRYSLFTAKKAGDIYRKAEKESLEFIYDIWGSCKKQVEEYEYMQNKQEGELEIY
ncbi:MAG: recombinase RecT [Spirochaetaceae bacterium]|nr:recombinase RecT [Spirochaetaceae bacterium]